MASEADFDLSKFQRLSDFPSQDTHVAEGQYALKTSKETTLVAEDSQIIAQTWFKTPALKIDTIRRIKELQLVAETHDQGFADNKSGGNWTWLELAIFGDENATTPRVKDGVHLIWESHENRFLKGDYGWKVGDKFNENDSLLRLLEDGDVIGVRICARFPGWLIAARTGYLVFNFKGQAVVREAIEFGDIVPQVKTIQSALDEVNGQVPTAGFMPAVPDGAFKAGAIINSIDSRPLRVLSLDGGGVRGLSSLHLLREVMNKAAPGKKPCEVFDMIGGTSTGGLIAIMLGRLEMGVDECITNYMTFMKTVFKSGVLGKNGHFLFDGEFYDAKDLEDLIKNVVRDTLKVDPDNVKLMDDESQKNPCKVFCMAVRRDADANRAPIFLRTYKNPNPLDPPILTDIKLWEAARATSAAPAYFAPLQVGGYTLMDGGLGANNPLGWLWTEVLGVYGAARSTNCFLSIGTGIDANKALPSIGKLGSHEVETGFASIATNTQIIHVLFRTLIDAFAPKAQEKKYWRLNIGERIPDWVEHISGGIFGKSQDILHRDDYKKIGDLDDVGKLDELMDMTKEYIKAQASEIDACAQALQKAL